MHETAPQREVEMLRELLGETIEAVEGKPARELVRTVRDLSHARRAGDLAAEKQLQARLAEISADEARVLITAFSVYFDFANLVEDRQRVRVLRERERTLDPQPRRESVADAVRQLHETGTSEEHMQNLLDCLDIEPVFTAHPTEAKRRSVREKVRDLRDHFGQLDDVNALPAEKRRLWDLVRGDVLAMCWRCGRPICCDGVDRP